MQIFEIKMVFSFWFWLRKNFLKNFKLRFKAHRRSSECTRALYSLFSILKIALFHKLFESLYLINFIIFINGNPHRDAPTPTHTGLHQRHQPTSNSSTFTPDASAALNAQMAPDVPVTTAELKAPATPGARTAPALPFYQNDTQQPYICGSLTPKESVFLKV